MRLKTLQENLSQDIIFIIIGEGEDRPKLEEFIIEKGLEEKFFLVGQIPNAYQYLPAFDVFVLTSIKEGFPWAILEAMSAKLPVIATHVGAVPEIIDDGINGYIVPPRNPEKIAEKINILLENELRAKEFGIQAHQKVLFNFTTDKMVDQIEGLL